MRWENTDRQTRFFKQTGFKISQGGMTRSEFRQRMQEKFNNLPNANKKYTISPIFTDIGIRGHVGEKLMRGSRVKIYDPSDSNIEEEEAGKIIGFYLFEYK